MYLGARIVENDPEEETPVVPYKGTVTAIEETGKGELDYFVYIRLDDESMKQKRISLCCPDKIMTCFPWTIDLEEKQKIGVKLGADIPYCLMGGTALSEGIGEILTKLPDVPKAKLVIAKPDLDVSTKFVYGNLHLDEVTEHPDIDGMVEAIRNHDLYGITDRMGNVLESVTCPAYPVIDEIKAQMMKNGAVNAMMSGSGPTVFGIFDDPDKAEFARDQLKISGLSKQTFLTTVSKPGGTKYGKK